MPRDRFGQRHGLLELGKSEKSAHRNLHCFFSHSDTPRGVDQVWILGRRQPSVDQNLTKSNTNCQIRVSESIAQIRRGVRVGGGPAGGPAVDLAIL